MKQEDLRRYVEKRLAEVIAKAAKQEVDPDFPIYHAFDIKSVKEMSRNDEAPILVKKRPLPTKFEDESTLFQSINDGFNE